MGQVLPQEPQLDGSVLTSVQVPLQTRLGDMQPLLLPEVEVPEVELDVEVDEEVELVVTAPACPVVVV
jgi:hypothetical protein